MQVVQLSPLESLGHTSPPSQGPLSRLIILSPPSISSCQVFAFCAVLTVSTPGEKNFTRLFCDVVSCVPTRVLLSS